MGYCKIGEKATVNYSFNGNKKTIVFDGSSPIDVSINGSTNSSVKCWRFSGQGRYNDYFYDFFACGSVPSWHDNGDYLQPVIDGSLFLDNMYGVRHGSEAIVHVIDDSPRVNYYALGSCSSCSGNGCTISISSNGKVLFTDTGSCPCTFTIACGNQCPDGTIRCQCQSYPGYCCIPCGDIEGRIERLTALVRSIKNG